MLLKFEIIWTRNSYVVIDEWMGHPVRLELTRVSLQTITP